MVSSVTNPSLLLAGRTLSPVSKTIPASSGATDNGQTPPVTTALDASGSGSIQPGTDVKTLVGQIITSLLQMMVGMLSQSLSSLSTPAAVTAPPVTGAADPATLAAATPPPAAPATSVPASIDNTPPTTVTNNNLKIQDTTTDPSQKAELDQSLAAIATDPDGAKLLAKAQQLGVSISVGNPATAAGANDVVVPCNCPACQLARAQGGTGQLIAVPGASTTPGAAADASGTGVQQDGNVVVNGVTLSNSETGKIRIVVRDPSNIKTIAHELVHAVSTQDGNSKEEEGIADVVGSRVANRLGGSAVGGLSGSDETIFQNKQQFYPTLMQTNDIRNTLMQLGILVNV